MEMQSSEKWGENSGRTTPHTSKEDSDDEELMLWGEWQDPKAKGHSEGSSLQGHQSTGWVTSHRSYAWT